MEFWPRNSRSGQYNLLWIVVLTLTVAAVNINYTCHSVTSTLTCDYDLPDYWNIPDGITEIYITDYKFTNISQRKHVFKHSKWNVIRTLDIVARHNYENIFTLNDYDFVDLPHLQRFGIHSEGYFLIRVYTFVGLYNLSYLDFSGCKRGLSRTIIGILSNENINFRLDYLNLDNIESFGRGLTIDTVFMKMVTDMKVLHLSIRDTQIFISDYSNYNYVDILKLTSLDISNSVVSVGRAKHEVLYNLSRVISNFKYINISRVVVGHLLFKSQSNLKICGDELLPFETLDASHINSVPLHITNMVDARCLYRLRHLYLHSNSIITLTATLYYAPVMEMVDLSWNGMELISTRALDGLVMLKSLNLSNNRLSKMEHKPEFKYLLMKLYDLENINLQNNSFTVLPKILFKSNTKLKSLILSNNQLKSIDFTIDHLHELELLDLHKNNILYLEHFQIQNLHNYLKLKIGGVDEPFVFNIKNNIFVCSCEHKKFIEWVSKELQSMFNETYTCSLEDEMVNINSSTLKRTSYLCYRTSVIIGSIVSIVVISIISGLTVMTCFRKRLRKKRITIANRFLCQLIKSQCDEKYLVFISYSSSDCLLINNDVEPALKYHLLDQYKIPERFIVTGDSTFRLGFPVVTEIIRCSQSTCVMVCLVSQSYCDSQWCQTEVRVAVEQGNPIILLFLEEIKQEDMPESLWMLFNRNTRSKLVQINGKYEPVAGWDNLCESIVTLASNKHSIDVKEHKRKGKHNETVKFEEDEVFL